MARYSHGYDETYDPSMPVVEVVVRDILTGASSEPMTAIVDSGADGCLIPINVLKDLSISPIRRARMRGVSGIAQSVDVFLVALEVGPITIKGIRVIGDREDNEVIIGRNVLNQLVVMLDGLAGEVEIVE